MSSLNIANCVFINIRGLRNLIIYWIPLYTLYTSSILINPPPFLCYIKSEIQKLFCNLFIDDSQQKRRLFLKGMWAYFKVKHLYADSISAWWNQGSVMCLLSILYQLKLHSGNIYFAIYLIIQLEMNPLIGTISKWKYVLLLKL